MSSELFAHNDYKQFQSIFSSICNSTWIQSMQISNKIIQEISEYSVGKWEFCSNKKCMNSISVLQQDLDPQNKQTIFKVCTKTQRYFCESCMDKAVHLTYCPNNATDNCCCLNLLHFIPNCDVCKCGNIIAEIYALEAMECECECCHIRECICCEKNYCKMCWQDWFGVCEGCGTCICGDCTVLPHSGHLDFPHVHSWFSKKEKTLKIESIFQSVPHKMCTKCYSKNNSLTRKCNKCQSECQLHFKGNPYLFNIYLNINDKHPLMIKCIANENYPGCDTYVCFRCGHNAKKGKIYLECSYCGRDVYPATLCAAHVTGITITCPECFYKFFGKRPKALLVNDAGQVLKEMEICGWCGKESEHLLRCGKCKHTYYCSVDCQRPHWKYHKKWCKKPSVVATTKRRCTVCQTKCKKVCSRCKKYWYCGRKHQKRDWNKYHRTFCCV
eukprot:308336_1